MIWEVWSQNSCLPAAALETEQVRVSFPLMVWNWVRNSRAMLRVLVAGTEFKSCLSHLMALTTGQLWWSFWASVSSRVKHWWHTHPCRFVVRWVLNNTHAWLVITHKVLSSPCCCMITIEYRMSLSRLLSGVSVLSFRYKRSPKSTQPLCSPT